MDMLDRPVTLELEVKLPVVTTKEYLAAHRTRDAIEKRYGLEEWAFQGFFREYDFLWTQMVTSLYLEAAKDFSDPDQARFQFEQDYAEFMKNDLKDAACVGTFTARFYYELEVLLVCADSGRARSERLIADHGVSQEDYEQLYQLGKRVHFHSLQSDSAAYEAKRVTLAT